LRAEVAAGTDSGNKAQEYMQKGMLVPDEIVVTVCFYCLCSALRIKLLWYTIPCIFTHTTLLNHLCDTVKIQAKVWFYVRYI
jgi:adenylate kinase family enzyme